VIEGLEEDRKKIKGYDTADDELAKGHKIKEELEKTQARLDGRFSEIVEAIRSSKVSTQKLWWRKCVGIKWF
jgi:hypothetical protein